MKLIPIHRDGTVHSQIAELPPEATGVLEGTAALYNMVGFHEPWICYIATMEGCPVGTCGFKSAPTDGRVEIAYFTFPGFEGRGAATQMTKELLVLAMEADPSVTVAAQTLLDRNASHRVLEKHDFLCMGPIDHPEDGRVLEWQRVNRHVA